MKAKTAIGLAFLGLGGLALAACTPTSAHEARGDLHLTAGAAASASKAARDESALMGAVAGDIVMDVNDIRAVEAWFDQRRPVSFD
jgi:hypothetical protein